MKLGTVVFQDKIYNLDYMSAKQIKKLSQKLEEEQKEYYLEGARIISRHQDN
jgi:hypothetical protein